MKLSLGQYYQSLSEHKLWRVGLIVCAAIVTIAVFQDYLHARRNGFSFFIWESLLFKVFWMLFPPILFVLKRILQYRPANSVARMSVTIIISTLVHLVLMALVIWCLSSIFREQNYGFFKVLTYSLANDLVAAILVYGFFVWMQRFWQGRIDSTSKVNKPGPLEYLLIQSGKEKARVNIKDIVFVKAATPYLTIYTENKDYLYTDTLKSITHKLNDRFVRVHRSSIVNIDKVIKYKSRLNGDYDLTLKNGSEIRLSRNYVSEFKIRFESHPQVNQ
ncbi:LytR/AlgR family response regulator transcription factor [Shewanella sp. GXUN23E]|uniref:LytR/AlgR family response regulator transcription factor n=1 Tax=Shewanella sp. GXUN23E TaxID=3422498 RepID=UPI003D7CD3E5